MDITKILGSHDVKFRYMMLDRMRSDCDYYLGNGRLYGNHLWAGSEEKQISYMKAIWESFPPDQKPQWLTYEEILVYERRINFYRFIRDYMNCARDASGAYPFAATFGQLTNDELLSIEARCADSCEAEAIRAAILAVVGTNPHLKGETR